MSYTRYLTAINTTLRQVVLPELQSGTARDAVNNSIRALAAIAAELAKPTSQALGSINLDALVEELKDLATTLTTLEESRPLTLPLAGPPDDFAAIHDALPLQKAGAAWLKTKAWPSDQALKKSAQALLAWESALRDEAMQRVAAAEQGFATDAGAGAVALIKQGDLENYLRKRFNTDALRITEFRFLSGGRNRQSALLVIEGTSELPARLVIQREPRNAMNTFKGIGMQYAVLQAAHAAGMNVARPVLVETSPDVLDGPFMISEQVRGASPVPSMDYWSPPPKSDRLAISLARQFAAMHCIPLQGLEGVLERYVDTAKGQTWLSDIETLETQWESLAYAPSMAVTAALAWMKANVGCVDATETVVHNDALLHNVLAEDEEITAVLDWEMAHIGHPGEDLGYVRPVVEQMTNWERFLDAYETAGGKRPTALQIDFFTLRSILKLMIQVLYVRNAFDSGQANVPALAEIGSSFMPKLIERLAQQVNRIIAAN